MEPYVPWDETAAHTPFREAGAERQRSISEQTPRRGHKYGTITIKGHGRAIQGNVYGDVTLSGFASVQLGDAYLFHDLNNLIAQDRRSNYMEREIRRIQTDLLRQQSAVQNSLILLFSRAGVTMPLSDTKGNYEAVFSDLKTDIKVLHYLGSEFQPFVNLLGSLHETQLDIQDHTASWDVTESRYGRPDSIWLQSLLQTSSSRYSAQVGHHNDEIAAQGSPCTSSETSNEHLQTVTSVFHNLTRALEHTKELAVLARRLNRSRVDLEDETSVSSLDTEVRLRPLFTVDVDFT